MPLLFDNAEKRWVPIPDTEMSEALTSGRYSPEKDKPLYLLSPEGERREATWAEAQEAFQFGWRVETPAERQKAYVAQTYGGPVGAALAAATGLASGATSGISNIATGVADPEKARLLGQLQEANPAAYLASEVVGAILPTVFTGGTVGAVKLLGGAKGAAGTAKALLGLTPAGALASAGRATQLATARVAGKSATSFLPRAAAGVVETVPAAIGLSLGQAVIDDTEITADALLANAGIAAVLGGVGVPALEAIVKRPFKALAPDVAKVASKVAGGGRINDPIEKATEGQIANYIVKKLSGPVGFFSDKSPEAFRRFANKPMRERAVRDAEVIIEKHVGDMRGQFDNIRESLRSFREAWGRNNKMRLLAHDFDGIQQAHSMEQAVLAFQDIGNEVGDYVAAIAADGGQVTGPLMRHLHELQRASFAAAKRVGDDLQGVYKHAAPKAAVPGGRGPTQVLAPPKVPDFRKEVARAFGELDDLKKMVGARLEGVAGHVMEKGTPGDLEALAVLRGGGVRVGQREFSGVYNKLRTLLEDKQLWGQAAVKQQRVNAAWADVLSVDEAFRKMFSKEGMADFIPTYKADSTKLRQFIQGNYHEVNSRFDQLNKYYRNLDKLGAVYQDALVDPTVMRAAKKLRAAAQGADNTLGLSRKDVMAFHALKELDNSAAGAVVGAMTVGGLGLGWALGDQYGGATGALGGMFFASLARPARLIRWLTALERSTASVQKGLQQKAKGFVRGDSKLPKLGIRKARPLQMAGVSWAVHRPGKKESRATAYKRLLSQAAIPMDEHLEQINKSLEPIHDLSPAVAQAASERIARAMEHFKAVAAQVVSQARPSMLNRDLPPPESQLVKLERTALALEDPLGSVDRIFDGTVTAEEIAALQAAYPALYQAVQDSVMEALATMEHLPPRHVQIRLSTVLGIPITATSSPEFAQAMLVKDMQTQGVPQVANPAGHAGTVNRGRLERVLSTHETTAQRIDARG